MSSTLPADPTVAVVGLGYVGLPLAVAFGQRFRTFGFDLSHEKVEAYRRFTDPTGEVSTAELRSAASLTCTTDPAVLAAADFIVVAVPTPVSQARQPDLTPLIESSKSVGRHLRRGAIVVYESTVYPGATEEVCVPIIEQLSGLRWQEDFLWAIARSESIPATRSTGSPTSSRSSPATRPQRWQRSSACTRRSFVQASTGRAASKWRRPRR